MGEPTRRITRAVVALLGLALALPPAWAPTAAAEGPSSTFAPTFSTGGLGEGGTLSAALSFSGSEYHGQPDPVTEVTLHLPAGVGETRSGFSTCEKAMIEMMGIEGCPPSSIAGAAGAVSMEAHLGSEVVRDIGTVQAVFAPGGALLFYLNAISPVTIELIMQGRFSTETDALTFAIPLIETVPGAPHASITALTLDFGASREVGAAAFYSLTLPEQCPQEGFSWAADVSFEDGESDHDAATSGCPQASAKTPTTTTLQASNASPAVGETLTYTATVTPAAPRASEPLGSVEFFDGAQPIAACSSQTLTAGASSSSATCQLSYPEAGSHTISARYPGDASFRGSFSSAQNVTVHASTSSGGQGPGSGTTPDSSPPLANVSLAGSTLTVQSTEKALVRLACTGTTTCAGRLTLSARSTSGKGRKKHTRTVTIGSASFSVAAGKTIAVKLALTAAALKLLVTAHGHLGANLTIVKTSPPPTQTHSQSVQLALAMVTRAKKKTRK
jgi:hypothetical protein